MPELCCIYRPIQRTVSNQEFAYLRKHVIWDLTREKIMYKGDKDMWIVRLDDAVLESDKLQDLRQAINVIAARMGWFTDYKEAKAFVARKNA